MNGKKEKRIRKALVAAVAALAVLAGAAVPAFALFVFNRTVTDSDVNAGKIRLLSKSFLSFAPSAEGYSVNSAAYLEHIKTRTQNPTEIVSAASVSAVIDGDGKGFSLENEYGITIAIVSGITFDGGSIVSAAATGADGLEAFAVSVSGSVITLKTMSGVTVAQADCTVSDGRVTGVEAAGRDMLTCYASEKGGYADEDPGTFYLNQLGFRFSFETEIPVYFRIHFKDAWNTTKTYISGAVKSNYITKGAIYRQTQDTVFLEGKTYYVRSGSSSYRKVAVVPGAAINGMYYEESSVSAFLPADTESWVYDESTNSAYYRHVFVPSGDGSRFSADFEINNEYWYATSAAVAFREAITVDVAFSVDICQANRAELLWDVDFRKLGVE